MKGKEIAFATQWNWIGKASFRNGFESYIYVTSASFPVSIDFVVDRYNPLRMISYRIESRYELYSYICPLHTHAPVNTHTLAAKIEVSFCYYVSTLWMFMVDGVWTTDDASEHFELVPCENNNKRNANICFYLLTVLPLCSMHCEWVSWHHHWHWLRLVNIFLCIRCDSILSGFCFDFYQPPILPLPLYSTFHTSIYFTLMRVQYYSYWRTTVRRCTNGRLMGVLHC